jgi:hypothetical protein
MELVGLIQQILTIAAGSAITYSTCYVIFKRKISAIRDALDTLDDALKDDRISEEEFNKLWQKFKMIIYA